MAYGGGGSGDSGDPVAARGLCGLDGEPVAGPEPGPLGEVAVDHEIGGGPWSAAGDEPVRRQRGGVPGVPVRGPAAGAGGCQRLGEEGQFGDDPGDTRDPYERALQALGEPGALGDRFRLVLDLGLALLVFDGGPVDVLVGGDHDGARRVALGADGAAQAGVEEGATGRDEGGRAHQGEKGAEETGLAGTDGPERVAQHHEGSVSFLLCAGSASASGAG